MKPLTIPGWFTEEEAQAIAKGALSLIPHAPGVLLEIGTWAGRSSAMLAPLLPGWQIHTVDCYCQYPAGALDPTDPNVPPNPRALAESNLAPFATPAPGRAQITRHLGESVVVARRWTRPVDVLFVDAMHTAAAVRADLEAWFPHLAPRSLVYLHDANRRDCLGPVLEGARAAKWPGVWREAPEFEADSLKTFARESV